MSKKFKLSTLFVFLILIFSITAVSASENTTDIQTINENNADSPVLGDSNKNDDLQSTSNTFTDLQNEVNKTTALSKIVMMECVLFD